MNKSAAYSNVNDVFSQEVKKVFLKLPHVVEKIHEKINLITFKKEEVKNSYLSNVKMIEVIEALTEDEYEKLPNNITSILFRCNYYNCKDVGIFINSNGGYGSEFLIQELMEFDEKIGKTLWINYLKYFSNSSEIVSVEEKLIRQIKQLKKYLIDENIRVINLGIDLESISKLTDDEQDKIVTDLYNKYGRGYKFKAYNDLDYTPFVYEDDVYVYDSSGARLYIIKENKELNKFSIYQFNNDVIGGNLSDWVSDFAYYHKQSYILYEKLIDDKYLVGEIENDKVTKSGYSFTNFELIHSFIVDELYNNGEIKYEPLSLSFNELLENFTLQKEPYKISTFAFSNLINDLKLINGVLTYSEFSKVEKDKDGTIEKDYEYFKLDELKEALDKSSNLLASLSKDYKEQIMSYVEEQNKKYPGKKTEKVKELVSSYLFEGLNKKKKMK